MPIRLLDKDVVSRIAAGEVIERPASVVKELIENSLDAGATRITVETRRGGVGLVQVSDNGGGIPADQVALAFERHATSKIASFEDLASIATLGFRGEALPSIAAVAEVEVLTCADGEAAGSFLGLEDGGITASRCQGRSRGTMVTVRHLFRRLPARLKFLKSESTESSHIAAVVSQYALAFPEVAFTLVREDRPELRTAGRGRLLDAIIEVFGVATAARMNEIRSEDWNRDTRPVGVSGMVIAPDASRARAALGFFVNRRWVNSRLLARAVEEAYQGLLMVDRHPLAVVNISLPASEVDVNVHPAKMEIKFRDESAVFSAVQRAVRRSLVEQAPVHRIEEAPTPFRPPQAGLYPHSLNVSKAARQEPAPQLRLQASLPVLRVIGQAMASYIIAEGPDGLYIIDQHAAHERVLYEKVSRQRQARQVESQGLLEPAPLEIEPDLEPALQAHLAALPEFGFELEPFGQRTYLVRAVPGLLFSRDWPAALHELLASLSGAGAGALEEAAARLIACHGAVRSGQALGPDEMRELVRSLELAENPHTCPHGRPTIIHLSGKQIARDFKRT